MTDHHKYHRTNDSSTTKTNNNFLRWLLCTFLCLVLGVQYYEIFNFDRIIRPFFQQHPQRELTTSSSSSSSSIDNTKEIDNDDIDVEEWTVTFLGDIMFSTKPLNWPERTINASWTMGESLDNLVPVEGDYIIGNLEGTITDTPLDKDPNGRNSNFSFAMPPGAELILKNKLHLNATNHGNNHVGDRNIQGFEDTVRYLDSVGIAHFGAGLTPEDQAIPHTFTTPFGQKVGVSSFHADTKCVWFKLPKAHKKQAHRPKRRTALDPGNETHVELAIRKQKESNTDIKIAFVHWSKNYVPLLDRVLKEYAPRLAYAGYDMIIGSGGTHTVKPVDFVNGVPVFYDVGNFLLEKATRFHYVKPEPDLFNTSLPYGSVAHVVFDSKGLQRLDIRCTLADNEIVKCKPRYCNDDESLDLFSTLGKYVNYTKGDKYATVDLRKHSGTGIGKGNSIADTTKL